MMSLARPHDTSELLRRLGNVHPDSVRRWGRMSVHQMVCHVADSFRMATGAIGVTDNATLPQRTIVKWLALYAPFRWPSGIPTCPEINQEVRGTRPVDFATDLATVGTLVREVAGGSLDLARQHHPTFGKMTRADWLRWGYLHLDHHLRQFGA